MYNTVFDQTTINIKITEATLILMTMSVCREILLRIFKRMLSSFAAIKQLQYHCFLCDKIQAGYLKMSVV